MKTLPSLRLNINWKQALLYESALMSLGLLIGSTWPEYFAGFVKWVLLAIFFIAGGYILLLWLAQNKDETPIGSEDRKNH